DGTFDTLATRTLGHGGELEAVRLDANPDWDQNVVRYRLDSLLTPTTLAQHRVSTGEASVLRRVAAARIDPEQYRERRLWAEAADGTPVPISLLHRRDITADGTAPGVLHGYGAFGSSIDPALALSALPLLDRGVVVAIAHVRGGGEMGPAWHHSAQREDKAVSFTDFLSCAEHLVDAGWVAADRLGAAGSGPGGLLVAASANLAPHRFRAVVAQEPMVDPLASLLDPGVLLSLQEWAEWGDPAEEESVYRALRACSPAENVGASAYPAVLAQAVLEATRPRAPRRRCGSPSCGRRPPRTLPAGRSCCTAPLTRAVGPRPVAPRRWPGCSSSWERPDVRERAGPRQGCRGPAVRGYDPVGRQLSCVSACTAMASRTYC